MPFILPLPCLISNDIQAQGLLDIIAGRFIEPQPHAGMMLLTVAGIPLQMGHGRGKMHGMLAGTAADLQYTPRLLQQGLDHLKDDRLVLLTGFGKGFVHGLHV